MILEKQTEGLILEEGTVQESTAMVIDADSHIFLMRMLSKFYSDAIGSLIRETASNALDSHRQAGIVEPIIVSLKNTNGNIEFSVEDFGGGIDDIIVENVIKKYGKSTKRNDAKALGAFGLGFKSPLAYGSSFYFTGRKGGMERKWMMYEAEDEQNKIDLLYEKPTTERNGVKITVPVKYYDFSNFLVKIKQQLCYFEHVYFDCGDHISNDFTILRHDHFQWSPLCKDQQMHICLDNVYYPIDWSKLGGNYVDIPVGLKFTLSDGIFPLPNREALKYTEEAKAAILKKIGLVADYFVEKYNEAITETDNLHTIFDHLSSYSKAYPGYGGVRWDLTELKKYSKIPFKVPKLKNLKKININRLYTMRDSLLKQYAKAYEYRNGRFTNISENRWSKELTYSNYDDKVYVFSDVLSKNKKDYYREQLGNQRAYFVRNTGDFPLKGNKTAKIAPNSFYTLLDLKTYDKKDWRDVIKDFKYAQSLLTKDFVDISNAEIPKEWFEARKKKKVQVMALKGTNVRRKKLIGEVTGKVAKPLERYVSDKNCKFESTVIPMKEAHKYSKFTIYGNQEMEEKIQKYFNLFDKKKVRFVIFSERELKNLKDLDLHNWITMEEFEKGEHKIFRRVTTAHLIQKLMMENPHTFTKAIHLKLISADLAKKIISLNEYKAMHYIKGHQDLYEEMVKVAEDKNLFDPAMYPLYKEVKNTIKKLPFLNTMLNFAPYSDTGETGVTEALRDLFKYYKMKIDWVHYKVKLNEETTEELTENLIEQLEETI